MRNAVGKFAATRLLSGLYSALLSCALAWDAIIHPAKNIAKVLIPRIRKFTMPTENRFSSTAVDV